MERPTTHQDDCILGCTTLEEVTVMALTNIDIRGELLAQARD